MKDNQLNIQVRILADIKNVGRSGGEWRRGQVIRLDSKEAGTLIISGSAELVDAADARHLHPGVREAREFREQRSRSGEVEHASGLPIVTPSPGRRSKQAVEAEMDRRLRNAGLDV